VFDIEMLPAREGDSLWVEYGDPAAPSRILIDCGYKTTCDEILERYRRIGGGLVLELFVITHIDGDHIAGALPFITADEVTSGGVREVWFNERTQLLGILGPKQGSTFAGSIRSKHLSWNLAFGGERKPVIVPNDGKLPQTTLPGGMRLTLLSPGPDQLSRLRAAWPAYLDALLDGKAVSQTKKRRKKTGILGPVPVDELAKASFRRAVTPANGSSIAFLAEYTDVFDHGKEKKVLFCGDAIEPVLVDSITRLLKERGGAPRLQLDAVKVSHHGSRGNTSPRLLSLLDSPRYLLSSNGDKTEHPDPETIAWILRAPRAEDRRLELFFNYETRFNERWRGAGKPDNYVGHFGDGTNRVRL
jgi:beta-lactamase superfamily II metal-dependent hydrolase